MGHSFNTQHSTSIQAKDKMRDFKDSAAADYSSKAAERMQEAGTKLGNTAESVTKGAEAAKETLQDAYAHAQESVQKESEVGTMRHKRILLFYCVCVCSAET